MPQDLIPLAEAAKTTGYNTRTLQQYCRDKTVKAVRIKYKWFVHPDEVERLRLRKALKGRVEMGCWNKTARELAREAKTRNWTPRTVRKAYLAGQFAQERAGCITMASEKPSIFRIVRRVFGQNTNHAHAGILEPTDGQRFAMICDPNNPQKALFKMIEENM